MVIGLREGLEAALIVGIVAAFLRQNNRPDLLKWAWAGVATAIVVCLGVGIALRVASENLPYRQQEGLETVIALVAVAMVTYMVVWMRRHARGLKAHLEGAAGAALRSGSGWALVAMAFLAVLREGFETSVFLVAAFNESTDPARASIGALIGITVAVAIGYAIYRGGLSLNLGRFFKLTGVVLVLVAAGLVMSAVHTAHEAGWLDSGQRQLFDLTWLVDPGSIRSSLVTGILGWQPRPTAVETIAYLAYLVPVLAFVVWPSGRTLPRRPTIATLGAAAGLSLAAAILIATIGPHRPSVADTVELATDSGALVVSVTGRSPTSAEFAIDGGSGLVTFASADATTEARAGRPATAYSASVPSAAAGERRTISLDELAGLNGGRLPLGVNTTTDPDGVVVESSSVTRATVWIDQATGVVLDAVVTDSTTDVAQPSSGPYPLAQQDRTVSAVTETAIAEQAGIAEGTAAGRDRADLARAWMWTTLVVGGGALVALGVFAVRSGRPPPSRSSPPALAPDDERQAAPNAVSASASIGR